MNPQSAVKSHRAEGDELLLHLFLPQLQQQAAVLLVKWTCIGQEACGKKDVPHQVFDLCLESSAAISPTDLKHSRMMVTEWLKCWADH